MDKNCAICLTSLSSKLDATACGHCFHTKCLDEWKHVSGNDDAPCPICRTGVVSGKQANIPPNIADEADDMDRDMELDFDLGHLIEERKEAIPEDLFFAYGSIPGDVPCVAIPPSTIRRRGRSRRQRRESVRPLFMSMFDYVPNE